MTEDQWNAKFNGLREAIDDAVTSFTASCVKNSADAAAKVAQEAVTHTNEVKQTIISELKKSDHARDELSHKLDELSANVNKLASARLMQQAVTSLALAGLVTILIKVLGG